MILSLLGHSKVRHQEKHILFFFNRLLVDNGSVSHDPKLGTFTVIGSMGKPHVVRTFPTETCSCPSSSQCYHIIAVKISLGIPVQKRKKVNLTQLRWNARSKNQKKAGRKRPRLGRLYKYYFYYFLVGDYDITPAPDSIISQQTTYSAEACNILNPEMPMLGVISNPFQYLFKLQ